MSLRLAVRGLILLDNRLLLVNAWPGGTSDLLCAPGGGVEPHASLPENLVREVHEETGLTVSVGEVALVNEFHDPDRPFHQVDVYFRCEIVSGDPRGEWVDPEGVVTERLWLTRSEVMARRFKPDSLPDVAWSQPGAPAYYDLLEPILR
ncbi:MAG: NUDIX domain-containing protein [Silicimonas sp.]|jgi:8-oxo-dGTP pyrophosphatase MutT (NUDIX family)|nr:NUDIX domain-containing protein [Silicimonas sp.]